MKVSFKGNQYQKYTVKKHLGDFITSISDPSSENSKSVFQARSHGKGTEKYKKIKRTFNAWYFNGIFRGASRIATFEEGTGLLYLDFDYLEDVNDFKNRMKSFPFVVAAWESVSGKGAGVLVRIPVISSCIFDEKRRANDLKNKFRNAYRAASEAIGFENDQGAANISQPCHQPFDCDPYFNPEATVLPIELTDEDKVVHKHMPQLTKPMVDSSGINLMDLSSVYNGFSFSLDLDPSADAVLLEGCISYPNGKQVLRAAFPKRVKQGRRAAVTRIPMSILMYINKHKPLFEFRRLMGKIMSTTFDQPWQHAEMNHHLGSWYNAVHDGSFEVEEYVRTIYIQTLGNHEEKGGRQRAGTLAFQKMRSDKNRTAILGEFNERVSKGMTTSLSLIANSTGFSISTVRKHLIEEGFYVDGRKERGQTQQTTTLKRIWASINKKTEQIMKLKRINQKSIAKETGVSRKTINKYWEQIKPFVKQCIEEQLLELRLKINSLEYRVSNIEKRAGIKNADIHDRRDELFDESSDYHKKTREMIELLDQL